MSELDLTGWNRNQAVEKSNIRSKEQLEKCSDEYVFVLAESIRDQRLLGRPTFELEEKLKRELTKMFAHTRAFFGKLPVEFYPSTSHLSVDSLNDTVIGNINK